MSLFKTNLTGVPSLTSPPPSLLFFRAPFTSHRSPLSERLEQASSLPGLALRGKGNISDGSTLRILAAHSLSGGVWQRRRTRSSFVCVWIRCFLSVAFSNAAPFHIQSLINISLRSPDWKYSEHSSSIDSPSSAKPWQTGCSLTPYVEACALTWLPERVHLSSYMPTGIRLIVDVFTQFTFRAWALTSPQLEYWWLASYFFTNFRKDEKRKRADKTTGLFFFKVHFYYDVSVSSPGQL